MDEIFDLKYYGNFSFYESFNLPTGLRRYYYQKLSERLEKEREEIEKRQNKGK